MNLLITGAWNDGKEYIDELKKLGNEVVFQQYETDKLACDYDWVEAVICNGLFLSHPIEKFSNLKYIQLTSAGFDRVSMEYIKGHNIRIHSARGVYSVPMAEFVVASVLQIYKQMNCFRESQMRHQWDKRRGLIELYGKTVCIVGCGNVGTECAKRFQAFGCHILGVDLYQRKDDYYDKIESLAKLDAILVESDVVVLTVPLTKETRYLINANRLNLMKKDSVLVNISRGAVVDAEALLAVTDKFAGVILDVFEQEPLEKSSRLWENKKILVTPHNSFVGDGNAERLKNVVMENIQKYYEEMKINVAK